MINFQYHQLTNRYKSDGFKQFVTISSLLAWTSYEKKKYFLGGSEEVVTQRICAFRSAYHIEIKVYTRESMLKCRHQTKSNQFLFTVCLTSAVYENLNIFSFLKNGLAQDQPKVLSQSNDFLNDVLSMRIQQSLLWLTKATKQGIERKLIKIF